MNLILDPYTYKNKIFSLIQDAKEFISIISFGSDLDSHQINSLRWASQRGVKIDLLISENLSPIVINTLKRCPRFYIGCNKKIRANVYRNESSAIIGSMNFSSIDFNGFHEAGVLVSKSNCDETFRELEEFSSKIKLECLELELPEINEKDFARTLSVGLLGYCAHCKTEMGLTYKRFLCSKCTEKFKGANLKKSNLYFFCHYCGSTLADKVEKPICTNCKIQKYATDDSLTLVDNHMDSFGQLSLFPAVT